MPLNIPNVPFPGEFLSKVLQDMIEGKRKEQEMSDLSKYRQGSLQQQANELAQKKAYEQGLLGLKQQEEARAAQKSAMDQYLARQLFGASPQQQGQVVTPFDQQNIGKMVPGDAYVLGRNEPPTQEVPTQFQPTQQQPIHPSIKPQPINKIQDLQSKLDSGQEVVVKQGDMSRAQWNKFAGSKLMGIKIPDVRSQVVDGVQYNTYPNGEVRAIKVGPSTEEKLTTKQNVSRSKDLVDTGKLFQEYSHHIESLNDLLSKNKDVTGLRKGFETKYKVGSPEAAIFQSHATPLIGKLAKEISSKGGAVAAGIAQAGKPDIFQPHSYNEAMVIEQARAAYNTYKNAKEEYESMNPGKEFPIKLPKFYNKWRIKRSDGLTFIKTKEEADKLAEKYPGTQILGNIYE